MTLEIPVATSSLCIHTCIHVHTHVYIHIHYTFTYIPTYSHTFTYTHEVGGRDGFHSTFNDWRFPKPLIPERDRCVKPCTVSCWKHSTHPDQSPCQASPLRLSLCLQGSDSRGSRTASCPPPVSKQRQPDTWLVLFTTVAITQEECPPVDA